MNPSNYVYVGVKGQVAAIDKATGQTLWNTKVKGGFSGGQFVTLLVDQDKIYAHTSGELYCLDVASGRILWMNHLPGMGYEIAALATTQCSTSPAAAAIQIQKQQSSAAATTPMAGS